LWFRRPSCYGTKKTRSTKSDEDHNRRTNSFDTTAQASGKYFVAIITPMLTEEEDRELSRERLRLEKLRRRTSRFRFAGRPHDENNNDAVVVRAIELQSSARQPGWSSHLRELLCGTRDPGGPLHLLRGHEATILRAMHDTVTKGWAAAVKLTPPAHTTGRMRDPS
jgi:hypothetical protein